MTVWSFGGVIFKAYTNKPVETGGFGDHVTPFHAPEGTPGEWMEDPYGLFGQIYVGPGQ